MSVLFTRPQGGGVRTYVEAKLKAVRCFGHEMIVVIPGERDEVVERAPGAYPREPRLAETAGRPPVPLFR